MVLGVLAAVPSAAGAAIAPPDDPPAAAGTGPTGGSPAVGDGSRTFWFTSSRKDLKDPTLTYTQDYFCSDFQQNQAVLYPYTVPYADTYQYRNLSSKGVTVSINPVASDGPSGKLAVYVTSLHVSEDYAVQAQVECSADNPDSYATIAAQGATSVTPTSASLAGNVSSSTYEAQPISVYAQYGTAYAQYGAQSSNVAYELPTGGTGVSIPLSGLQPNTTYHYRLAVVTREENYSGLVSYSGPDQTFTTGSDAAPTAGYSYVVQSAAAGQALEAPETRPGAALVASTQHDGTTQQWQLVDAGDGYFKLVNHASDRCLQAGGGASPQGVIQRTCDRDAYDQPDQLWKPVAQPDGTYSLVSKATQNALTARGEVQGGHTPLVHDADAGSPAQRWMFKPVGSRPFGVHVPSDAPSAPPPPAPSEAPAAG